MFLVGKYVRKTPLERLRLKLENEIRMHPGKIDWGGLEYIQLAQCRDWWRALVNTVLNL
jgi:hypothetical protein